MFTWKKKGLLSPFDFLIHLFFRKKNYFLFFACPLNFQFFCVFHPKKSSNKSICGKSVKKNFVLFELLWKRKTYFRHTKVPKLSWEFLPIKTGSLHKPSFPYSHALTIALAIEGPLDHYCVSWQCWESLVLWALSCHWSRPRDICCIKPPLFLLFFFFE